MIANLLVSPPGLLKINNPQSYFAPWFVKIYNDLYENASSQPVYQPQHLNHLCLLIRLPLSHKHRVMVNLTIPSSLLFYPPFPSSLQALVSDRLQLNRLLGLSNLYYIDPDDTDVKTDLIDVRSKLAQSIPFM